MIAMMMTLLLPVRRRLLAIPYHRRCTTTTPTLRTCTRLLLSSIFVAALLIGINPDSTNISTSTTSTSTSTIATTPIIIEAFSPTPITINNYNNNNNNNERRAVTSISVSLFLSSLGSTAEEQEQQIRKTTTITTTAMDNPDSSSNTRWEKEETGTKISITLPSFAPPSINSIAAINDLDTNDAYLLSSSSSSSSSRLLHQLHIRSILSTKEVDQVLHLALEHAELNRSFDTPDTDRHVSYSTCDFPVEECAQLQQYLEYDCHFTQRILQHFQRLYNITASASPTSTSIEEEEEDVDDHIDDTVLSFDDLFVAYYEAKNDDDDYDDDTNNSSTNKGATNTHDIMDRLELHRDGPLLSFSLLLNPPEEFTGGGTFYDALRDVDIDAVNVDTSVKNVGEGQQQQQQREYDDNMVKPDTDNSKKKKEDPHHGYSYCYRDDNEKGQEEDYNPDDNNDTGNRREDKKKKILYSGGIIRPSRAGDAVLHCGKILHGADTVTSGRRIVLVGFINVSKQYIREGVLPNACKEWGRQDVAKFRYNRQQTAKRMMIPSSKILTTKTTKHHHRHDDNKKGGNGDEYVRVNNSHWFPRSTGKKNNNISTSNSVIRGDYYIPLSAGIKRRGSDPERCRLRRLETEDILLRNILLPSDEIRPNTNNESEKGDGEEYYHSNSKDDITIYDDDNGDGDGDENGFSFDPM